MGRSEPCAMIAPVDLLVIQQEVSSKWATAWLSCASVLTKMSLTAAFGMNRTFFRIICAPRAMRNLMSPRSMAVTDDPPTPFTDHAAIGRRVRKSECSGEM